MPKMPLFAAFLGEKKRLFCQGLVTDQVRRPIVRRQTAISEKFTTMLTQIKALFCKLWGRSPAAVELWSSFCCFCHVLQYVSSYAHEGGGRKSFGLLLKTFLRGIGSPKTTINCYCIANNDKLFEILMVVHHMCSDGGPPRSSHGSRRHVSHNFGSKTR